MKKTIDFVKYGKRLGIISACVLIVGLLFSVIFPVDLDISFKGGTQVKFSYVGDINKTELKQQVEEQLGEKVEMKDATTYDGEKQLNTATFYLTKNLDSEKTDKMEKAVIEKYKDNELTHVSTNSLSPTMGKLFFAKCLVAVALAAALLLIYVAIRFRKIGGLSRL